MLLISKLFRIIITAINITQKQQDYLEHSSSGPYSITTGQRYQVHCHPGYSKRLTERLEKELRHVENGVPNPLQSSLLPHTSNRQQKIINQIFEKYEKAPLYLPSSLKSAKKIQNPPSSSSTRTFSSSTQTPLSTCSGSSFSFSSHSSYSTTSRTGDQLQTSGSPSNSKSQQEAANTPIQEASSFSLVFLPESRCSTTSTTVRTIQPIKFAKVTKQLYDPKMTENQKKEARRQKAQELMSFLYK